MLTADRLRKLLSFNPTSGKFRWRVSKGGVKVGGVAGFTGRKGYHQIHIDGTSYQAGRLAWLYTIGRWPKLDIDYINRNRSDIRWSNLREITASQRRAKARTNNKLGVKGVWITRDGRYAVRIRVANKRTYLGSFGTLEKASAAYLKAAKEAFGEFARAR